MSVVLKREDPTDCMVSGESGRNNQSRLPRQATESYSFAWVGGAIREEEGLKGKKDRTQDVV